MLPFPSWKTSLLPSTRAPYNQEKNRYGDVPCLDQTRVKLAKPYSRPEVSQPGMETQGSHVKLMRLSRPRGSGGAHAVCIFLPT